MEYKLRSFLDFPSSENSAKTCKLVLSSYFRLPLETDIYGDFALKHSAMALLTGHARS